MKYITNTAAIVLFLDGKSVRVEKTDRRYPLIVKVFQLPLEDQEAEVNRILGIPEDKLEDVIADEEHFDVVDGNVYYNGEELPPALSTKVKSIIKDGLPLGHFEAFWKKLSLNPSSTSVKELVDFLEYKELPITEDGCFLAYKGVSPTLYSIHGNKETKVVRGQVDETGHIYNGVGEIVEVLRRDVDDNRHNECSHGLHVGSLDYASGWGHMMVVVKVNPADVVSVPAGCSFQKCRVCKYEVVSAYGQEITASVVDEKGESTLVPDVQKERSATVDRIEKYLTGKREDGYDEVTVRQIQNIFSPNWVTRMEVLDALQELDEYWESYDGADYVEL
jgi:hypothetical protein